MSSTRPYQCRKADTPNAACLPDASRPCINAISLAFGLASSTVLTVLVIPAIYVWFHGDGPATGA